MKKYFIIFAMVFIFSGCTVNYNIEIKKNMVSEQIEIIESNQSIHEDLVKKFRNEKIYSQYNNLGIKEYKKNEETKDNNQIFSLKQEYNLMDYKLARALTECFDAVNLVKNEDDNYIFQTSKGFKCMIYNYYPIESYKVNITIDYDIINSNADNINGNVYTWNINSKNADSKYINIEFKEKTENSDIQKQTKEETNTIIFTVIIIVIIFIVGLIAGIYALNLNRKRNKL